MKGYKGFGKGLICKGKQYAENTVFEEENAALAFLNGSSHRQLEILEIINKLVKEYEKGR